MNIDTQQQAFSFWAKDSKRMYWHIAEGTGDNLLQEDIDAGYVDYIYYDNYVNLNAINNDSTYDGGMVLLKKLYKEHTLQEIIDIMKENEGVDFKEIERE